jgi:hypothetical protein
MNTRLLKDNFRTSSEVPSRSMGKSLSASIKRCTPISKSSANMSKRDSQLKGGIFGRTIPGNVPGGHGHSTIGPNPFNVSSILFLSPTMTMVIFSGKKYVLAIAWTSAGVTAWTFWTQVLR